MTLKSSLWKTEKPHNGHSFSELAAQMRENWRRRTWLFALLSFVMLLCYPLMTGLTLSRYAREGASLLMRQSVGHIVLGLADGATVFLATVGGVLCAREGFSWIYSRKKVDMYLSQPITAGRRFLFTYINGILLYFVPYLISLLFSLLVISGTGASSGALFMNVLFTVPAALVYFLAVYNMTLAAMMISGRKGMAGFFVLMGFLYDAVLRATLEGYCGTYFSTFVEVNRKSWFLSPIFRIMNLIGDGTRPWEGETVTAKGVLEQMVLPMLPGMFSLLAEAAVFGVIAYYCYKKRPMEASKAVVFSSVRGPVKVLLMLLSGLLGSVCFCDISGSESMFVALPGLLLGILFCQVLMEIIYEGDLRAFANHKKSFAAGAFVTLSVYLFFALDIGGYDTWVPGQEQVESAAIEIYFNNHYCFDYVDEKGKPTWDEDYGLQNMKMTDVSGVLSLARDGMGKGAPKQNPDTQVNCEVKYTLKSGAEKYRSFWIDYEQEKTVLDILFANEQYKEGANQVLSGQMDMIFGKSRIYYDNGLQETEIMDKSAFALMRAYQSDLRKMSFSDVKNAVPCGVLRLRYKTDDGMECQLEYPVFSSYTGTVEYLRAKSIELYLTVNPKAVDSIRFERYEEREDEEVIENGGLFGGWSSTVIRTDVIEKEYHKRAEIEELLGYLYPTCVINWAYTSGMFDEDIAADIQESDHTEAYFYHWDNSNFSVKKDRLPEYVKEDLYR